MARDLIPPPSPAGRPPADGTTPSDVPRFIELPPEPPRSGAQPAQAPPPSGPSDFRNRFGFLLGALAGVVIAAAVAAVLVLATDNGDGADAGLYKDWSAWKPADTDLQDGASAIAEHVGAEYTHPDGRVLLKVDGFALDPALPITVRPASGPVVDIDGGRVLYRLDGFGPNRSIDEGRPSIPRARVVRREALELALYTFRYLPDAESVVVLLTPAPPTAQEKAADDAATAAGQPTPSSQKPQPALLYRPGDLKTLLQVPLSHTLSPGAPNTDTYAGTEAKTVDLLTLSNSFVLTETQSGLLLSRPTSP
jgi:hypothetical protein